MAADLLDRLFAQAREVVLGNREQVDLGFDDLAELVSNAALQARFRTRFRLEAQNEEARELILLLLLGVAAKAGEASEQIVADAEGLAGYVGRPALGLIAAAVASLLASGGMTAFMLLGAGLLGSIGGGVSSQILKKRAIRLKSFAGRVQSMVGDLRNA